MKANLVGIAAPDWLLGAKRMLRLAVRHYARPFRVPLRTRHGLWSIRAGLLLRAETPQGIATFGEIVPIPWFGTETLETATRFCAQWPTRFPPERMRTIPLPLSACRFGFASLLARIGPIPDSAPGQICALLPTGAAALESWSALWRRGHRTFKWKIGVEDSEIELTRFRALVDGLPPDVQLRLDANGGLTPDTAVRWLRACDEAGNRVEFLEQPLPPQDILPWLQTCQDNYQTAIALDESVATLTHLRHIYQQVGNRVIYVVKPAIAGFPEDLYDFCAQKQLDMVFSSALETCVGRGTVLALAQRLWAEGMPRRALGFGTSHWFADDWDTLKPEALWECL